MISPRRLLLGLLFGVLLVASLTVTFAAQPASVVFTPQAPSVFQTTLPADLDKSDLWIARLDPCPSDPEGALFMVQRRFLGGYARGRANGYPWSWAPLKDVLRTLDAPPAVDPKDSQELARTRAAIASAISTLSSVSP